MIMTFLGTYWIWFVIIAILLIFALIGYIVDSNNIDLEKPEVMSMKTIKEEKKEETFDDVVETLDEAPINNDDMKIVDDFKEEEKTDSNDDVPYVKVDDVVSEPEQLIPEETGPKFTN